MPKAATVAAEFLSNDRRVVGMASSLTWFCVRSAFLGCRSVFGGWDGKSTQRGSETADDPVAPGGNRAARGMPVRG
jgi:hypothetical protein